MSNGLFQEDATSIPHLSRATGDASKAGETVGAPLASNDQEELAASIETSLKNGVPTQDHLASDIQDRMTAAIEEKLNEAVKNIRERLRQNSEDER